MSTPSWSGSAAAASSPASPRRPRPARPRRAARCASSACRPRTRPPTRRHWPPGSRSRSRRVRRSRTASPSPDPATCRSRSSANYVDEVVTVSEDDIARALLVLLERAKQVVEPAGAVGVAAILAGKIKASGPTVTVLSGGNIDPLLLQRVVVTRARGIRSVHDAAHPAARSSRPARARVGAARAGRARTSSRCCTPATVRACRSAR